jgi:3-oxoacyl-[acyl-carrier-protein] synthase III
VGYGAQTLREVAQKAEIDIERIRLLASAEPRGWIPRGVLRVLGLSEDLAVSVYEDRGHLGASGCVANLEKAYRQGRTRGSGVAALYAQGAGFTRAAVLLQMGTRSAERVL